MAHRLLHSLVFSSVVLLEGLGCSISHGAPPPLPDAGPGGDGGPPPPDDAHTPPLDAGWFDDAGALRDAGAILDAHFAADAGWDGGSDAGPLADGDAGPRERDAGPRSSCEEGWPPTKGFWCVMEDEQMLCCRSSQEATDDTCCVVSGSEP